jgi:hypothetical protein
MTPFPQDGGSLATLWRDAGNARGAVSPFPPLHRGAFGATTILSPLVADAHFAKCRAGPGSRRDRLREFWTLPAQCRYFSRPDFRACPFCEENPRSPGAAAALTRILSRARKLIHARAGK